MTTSPPEDPGAEDPENEIPDFIPDDLVAQSGPTEASAEERMEHAARIARENDRLKRAGQISDGTGKPVYRRAARLAPWVAIGAGVAIVIILVAVLAG